MKQEIITYLSTIKDLLQNVSKYLQENPEESFHEYKACNYLINILKENSFKVTDNFQQIPTSFYAEYGSNHPRICYLCEYDAVKDTGHITGHNLVTEMSLGAALALSKVVDKIGGSVVVIGCPGEYLGGTKVTMAKQGVFKEMDLVLMAHPDIITAESGTSSAILPLSIKFKSSDGLSYLRKNTYSALDACIFTFTSINQLTKGFTSDVSLDGIIANGGINPSMFPNESESKFYIRASTMKSAYAVKTKIEELVKATSSIMNLEGSVSLYDCPHDELVSNKALARLFCHNLKENGIIDSLGIKDTSAGLSLGAVSHVIPCIHPYIGILEDNSISYSTRDFAKATLSKFAQDKVIKTAQTLAITALDIISKEELLNEIRNEFYTNKTV